MGIIVRTAGVEDYLDGGQGRLKFLLVANAGEGKTRFSAFSPKPIYADCEDGMLSVVDQRVPFATIKSEQDMKDFLRLLEDECRLPRDQRRWETAVIDTIDSYERLVVQNYLKKKNRAEMDGYEDWGYLNATMTNLMQRLALLDMNVIVLVHPKQVKRKGQIPEDQLTLRLKGDVGQQLPNDFDFVGMIELSYVPGQEGREIKREIRWESTPAAPWLKFRGQGVKTTPLTFSTSDFAAIRQAVIDGAGGLQGQAAEQVQVVESVEDAGTPVAPTPGVALPVSKSATRAASAPTPPPPPGQAPTPPPPPAPTTGNAPTPPAPPAPPVPPVPAAPRPAPVPAAPRPDPSAPTTTEQAVANVQAAMPGSTVIADSTGELAPPAAPPAAPTPPEAPVPILPDPAPEAPAEPEPEQQALEIPEEGTTTPVAEPEPEADPAAEQADNTEQEAAAPAEVPSTGTHVFQCGDARFAGTAPKATAGGCGKTLTVTLQDARIVGVEEDEQAQFIEMATLSQRAVLCNECFATARKAAAPSA